MESLKIKLDKKPAAQKFAEGEKQFRKELLSTEEALDKVTLNKIKEKWYNTLVNFKIPEMQDNLRHILFYMEKLIEADTFRKSLFEEERRESQEQITAQSQSHASALDVLYDIFQKRLQDMHEAFQETALRERKLANEEIHVIEDREKSAQEALEALIFQVKIMQNTKEDSMNINMFLKLDDEISKYTEQKESLRVKLERKMEKRWNEISSTMMDYECSTQRQKNHYLQLKAKDEADSRLIYQQMKKTHKLFEQLDELKNVCDICFIPRETLSLMSDLREEKLKFSNAFNYLKKVHAEEVSIDKKKLKTLTVSTNQRLEELRNICTNGERILTLFRICLKMETEQEKILPVGSLLTQGKPIGDGDGRKSTINLAFINSSSSNYGSIYEIFNEFWKKVSNVRLSSLALTKYVSKLERQNTNLRRALSLYLHEVSTQKLNKKYIRNRML